MHSAFATAPAEAATPITFATKATWASIGATLEEPARRFAEANGFAAKPGQYLALPAAGGAVGHVLFGLGDLSERSHDPFLAGKLPGLLPAGVYRFANAPHDPHLAALAFALGSYRFGRYRKADPPKARLVPPDGVDISVISRMAEAATLARDLINTPANDMGPEELAAAAESLAYITGSQYHLIHTFALLACSMAAKPHSTIAGSLFLSGMTLFSGSLYAMGVTENRQFGAITPIGGFALMGGWLVLAFARFRIPGKAL